MAQLESQRVFNEPERVASDPIRRFALLAGVTTIAMAVFGLLYYFVLYISSQ